MCKVQKKWLGCVVRFNNFESFFGKYVCCVLSIVFQIHTHIFTKVCAPTILQSAKGYEKSGAKTLVWCFRHFVFKLNSIQLAALARFAGLF